MRTRRAELARRPGAVAALCAIFAASAAACSHGDPARGGAERFVDAYYVEIDLPRARNEAVGLARAKVDDELKLLTGQEAPESGIRPTVHYRLVDSQGEAANDRRGFVFELSIHTDSGDELTRRVLVTMREEAGAWHAANFQEID